VDQDAYITGPPWKLAVIGMVAIIAGLALFSIDWTLAELAAFVGMFFVARGALHIVTTSFDGLAGALSALLGWGEVAIGVTLLAWPTPTLLVFAVLVGSWVLAHGIVAMTVVLATRAARAQWQLGALSAIVDITLGVILITRPGGSVGGTAVTLGLLAVLVGALEIAMSIARRHNERRVRALSPVASVAAA
jgi:uncharacterized membrane protein HdeD (DUF308 family)